MPLQKSIIGLCVIWLKEAEISYIKHDSGRYLLNYSTWIAEFPQLLSPFHKSIVICVVLA